VGADLAACAVVWRDLDPEFEALELFALGLDGGETLCLFLCEEEWADDSVGADKDALVALDALGVVPNWENKVDTALLDSGGVGWHGGNVGELLEGDLVTAVVHGELEKALVALPLWLFDWLEGGPLLLVVVDLAESFDGVVNHLPVLLNDFLTLALVGLGNGGLHELDGVVLWDDVGKLEEDSLHDLVDTAWHAHLNSNAVSINGIDFGMLVGNGLAELGWEVLVKVNIVWAVNDKGAAVLQFINEIELLWIESVVAGNVVAGLDKVGGGNWLLAKSDVGHGETTRFVGIVGKVGLAKEWSVVDNDLDGIFVGTNSTVGSKTPEEALGGALWKAVKGWANWKLVGTAVETDSEAVLWVEGFEVLVDGFSMVGSEVFGTNAITSANDLAWEDVVESSSYIAVEGFSAAGNFTNFIKNTDALGGGWKSSKEVFEGEWSVEVDFDKTNLLAWVGADVLFKSAGA